tara:strand:+ start:1078 stop:1272 length:195 start_codon:yes stop_codon:yes gene_type:complete
MFKFFKIENISMDNGVFPVPPKYTFPTQITGIEDLCVFVRDVLKKNKNLINIVNGNSKTEKNEI